MKKIKKEKSNIVQFRKYCKPRTSFAFKLRDNDLDIVSNFKFVWLILDEKMTSKIVDAPCGSDGRALGSVINKFKYLHNIDYSTFSLIRYIIELLDILELLESFL